MQDRLASAWSPSADHQGERLLAVENLTVERGGRVVLSGLTFTLGTGEAILVAGRNGAGKSTLLRTLAGLLPHQAGRITYGLADEEVRGVETLHYLGYEDALKPSLTVGENLEFWAAMLGAAPGHMPARHSGAPQANPEPGSTAAGDQGSPGPGSRSASPGVTPRDALAAFGIARLIDLPAAYLSAGQKRRVALARLVLAARPIWLLDEPLIALDAGAQATLTTIMQAHLDGGGAILVASHQPLALPYRTIDLAAKIAA